MLILYEFIYLYLFKFYNGVDEVRMIAIIVLAVKKRMVALDPVSGGAVSTTRSMLDDVPRRSQLSQSAR
jgi:hypothetical protein